MVSTPSDALRGSLCLSGSMPMKLTWTSFAEVQQQVAIGEAIQV